MNGADETSSEGSITTIEDASVTKPLMLLSRNTEERFESESEGRSILDIEGDEFEEFSGTMEKMYNKKTPEDKQLLPSDDLDEIRDARWIESWEDEDCFEGCEDFASQLKKEHKSTNDIKVELEMSGHKHSKHPIKGSKS